MEKTRILISSHSPCIATGLAETIRLIFRTLLARYAGQYEIVHLAQFHQESVYQPEWRIIPTERVRGASGQWEFPRRDRYGEQSFDAVVREVQPDIVWAFGDPQSVAHICLSPEIKRTAVVLYLNFDGVPIPEGYREILQRADAIYTKTAFARGVMLAGCPELGAVPTGYVYAPADLGRFYPADNAEKATLRAGALFPSGIPQDAFILGWVGRNQWRKQIWQPYKLIHHLRRGAYAGCATCGKVSMFDWDVLNRRHSALDSCKHCGSAELENGKALEDVYLWCHMPLEGGAWPLRTLEAQFDLQRGRDVIYTDDLRGATGLPANWMPALYRMWDGLLYLSGGEGFGLPVWEAMSSGLPVIFTDYSGHGELLRNGQGGLPVGGIFQPESDSCIWRMVANIDEAVAAVLRLYNDAELRHELGRNGRQYVKQYDTKAQVDLWHRIFQEHRTLWRRSRSCALTLEAC